MRTLHRTLAIFAALLMLYLGATGTLIQSLDLAALLSNAPESDPVIQSIEEGRYGNGDFTVISARDFGTASLPADVLLGTAMDTALAALERTAPGAAPRFAELRMVEQRLVGQFKLGDQVLGFDAVTGEPVAVAPIPRFTPLPYSLRQYTKELHRFWTMSDKPGVYFELLSGIVLWVLIISGLWMYYKLMAGRVKTGRSGLLWMGGGMWRSLHRIVSLLSAVFLIAIAFSGTFLGFESVWHTFVKVDHGFDASAPLQAGQVRAIAAAALENFRKTEPSTPVKVVRARIYGGMPQGVIVTGGASTRQVVYDARNGNVATLYEPGYPVSGFPFGTQVHEDIKHFHSGDMFGLPARVMNLLGGLALVYLSVSGIVMYVQLWLRRKKNGKSALLWT
ncbi:PepSY-associated TM helix domain-containing protein [Duganella sp. PWIR1]